jgi:hypothetical protein
MTPSMATLESREGHNACYLHNKASSVYCSWQSITLPSHKSPSQCTSKAINPSTQPTRCLVLSCPDRQHVRLLVSFATLQLTLLCSPPPIVHQPHRSLPGSPWRVDMHLNNVTHYDYDPSPLPQPPHSSLSVGYMPHASVVVCR